MTFPARGASGMAPDSSPSSGESAAPRAGEFDGARAEPGGNGSTGAPPAAVSPPAATRPPLTFAEQRLLDVIACHVGAENAIDQLRLAELIGFTTGSLQTRRRKVQKLIDSVRDKRGVPIFSSCHKPMGVFIARSPADTEAYFSRMTNRVVAELETIRKQKAIAERAFDAPQRRLFPPEPDRAASGLSGAATGKPRRSCKCGCGRFFEPGPFRRKYLDDEHKKRHEATFYQIGRAVVEAGLEGVFEK